MRYIYLTRAIQDFVATPNGMAKNQVAVREIEAFFESSERVYWPSDMAEIFARNRLKWRLPKAMTSSAFVDWLLRRTKLKRVKLISPRYPEIVRFGWDDRLTPALLGLSTNRRCYLSHGSALWVHGLGGNEQEIFVNHEQSEKPPNSGGLTQEGIDRAFRNQPRRSNLIYRALHSTITILNGKHTSRLGVGQHTDPNGDVVETTSLERTLIDIVVRPNYAGGVAAVARAYAKARARVSVPEIVRLLRVLDYTYPYHQAIGFYLSRTGFSSVDLKLLHRIGLQFDFYLCYKLSNPLFDREWRIWYPNGMDIEGTRERPPAGLGGTKVP